MTQKKAGSGIKWFLIILMAISLCIMMSGCGWIDQLQEWKNGSDNNTEDNATQQETTTDNSSDNAQNNTDNNAQTDTSQTSGTALTAENSITVSLYFASADGKGLTIEKRSIPKKEGLARETINQLISGPSDSNLLPTIPSETVLQDINIRDGVCIIDFSSELVDSSVGGLQNEELTVYSIVDTLTQFSSVNEVTILVEGQKVASLGGHVMLEETMAPDYSLVQ